MGTGTWSGLGPPVAAQASPLGLLVASRSSSLRMAVALEALLAIRAIRRRQIRHEGWQAPNHAMEAIVRNANQWLLWAVLTAVLVVAATYCVSVWQATPSMPLYRNIIFGGAIVLMLVFGCGLIALMLYSRRKGYDQPARSNRTQRK